MNPAAALGFLFVVGILQFATAYEPEDDYGSDEIVCTDSPYRSIDGSCNNLYNPIWGRVNSTYLRLLPPNYEDGVREEAQSVCGGPLPNARLLSYTLFPDKKVLDDEYTLAFMQFGQFMAHDGSSLTSIMPNGACCTRDGKFLSKPNKDCISIPVPAGDPDYKVKKCLSLARSVDDIDMGTNNGDYAAEQISGTTPFYDLDIAYGNTKRVADKMRLFQYGLLKTEERLNQSFPMRSENPSGECFLQTPDEACYFQSDDRLNQNPELTLLHVMIIRSHNNIAKNLAYINPQWCDERLYQEARKINIAIFQKIAFYEWLPPYFGDDGDNVEIPFGQLILFNVKGYVHDYDPYLKPGITQEFAHNAFRHGHTFILGQLQRLDEYRQKADEDVELDEWFFRPSILEESTCTFDRLTTGLFTQAQSASDRYIDKAVSVNFAKRNATLKGVDLKAIDIQRARNHGLPSYNDARVLAGLPRAVYFEDFSDVIAQEDIEKMKALYCKPDDVDLVVGATLEITGDALIGPTETFIFLKQFRLIRQSDRFWFEKEGVLTKDQLLQIRNASISRFICDNGMNIQKMQVHGFKHIDETKNPLVDCSELPFVDLIYWKEDDVDTPRYNNSN